MNPSYELQARRTLGKSKTELSMSERPPRRTETRTVNLRAPGTHDHPNITGIISVRP